VQQILKKQILLLSEIYPPASGGSGRWFSEIYPQLPDDRCTAVTHTHDGWEEYDRKNPSIGMHREDLFIRDRAPFSINSLLRYLTILRTARRVAKRNNVTQIHAARPLHEGLVARLIARSLKIPFLCYVHGEDLSVALTSRQLKLSTNFTLEGAAKVICNSQFTKSLLLSSFSVSQDKIKIIHPGVDTNFFTPTERCQATRDQLGWGNRKVILTVGRLQRRKGQDTLIKAIPNIRKVHPDILYAIVGEGAYGEELKRLAKAEGVGDNVLFHGEVSDLKMLKCYQQCDLFCLPNRDDGADVEGFGMVSLEAQACGKPALVGDSGGAPETVAEGTTGFAIDCTSPQSIASKVVELLNDPTAIRSLGQDARRRAMEEFDWAAIVNQSDDFFHQIERIG
jgi:phosphatidylinositol alpha-1,6-mannosyltransferase